MGSRDRIVEAVGGIEAARALIAANNDDLRLPGWRFDLQCHRSNLKDAIDRAADNVAGLVAIPVFFVAGVSLHVRNPPLEDDGAMSTWATIAAGMVAVGVYLALKRWRLSVLQDRYAQWLNP